MPTARLDDIEDLAPAKVASIADIDSVVERKPDPKPPFLTFLPDLPKAPTPSGLKRTQMDEAMGDAVSLRTRQIEPAVTAGKKVAEFSQEGAREAKEGFGQLTGSGKTINERATGAHRMLAGGAQAVAPVLAAPLAVAAARTPIPVLASMAGGMAAQYGASKGLKAVGVPEGVADLAGDIAGLPGYTGAMGAGARALRNLPWLKNAPKQAAESAAEVMARETIPAVSPAAESAKTFQAIPAPKSAEESAKVFDTALSKREAQAAAKAKKQSVQVPEEGIPEEVARLEDARQRFSQQAAGKPYEQLADAEKKVVDDLIAESEASQGARAPKEFPRPISSRRKERNQRGSLTIPSKAAIKSGINEALLKFEENVADRYARIRDLETAANIPSEESVFVGARQYGGHAGKIQDKLIDLRRILRPAKKEGFLNDAIEYAKLERHEERFNADPQNYVIEGNKTIQDVLAGKAGMEQKLGPDGMKKVNAFNTQLREYNDSLMRELLDSGVISKESYDAMRAANQKYIPFQRVEYMKELMDADSIPAGSNAFSVASQNVVHGITGSEKEIFDPIQSIVRNTYRVKSLVERNNIAKNMAAHADRPEFKGAVIKLKPNQQASGAFDSVSYMEDGIVKKVAVPKGVAAAMKQMGKEEADIITRSMAWWGRALRTGVTLDPVFMAGNIIRDYQTATAAAKLNGLGFTPADWATGLISAATRGIPENVFPKSVRSVVGENAYRKFLRSGGAFGGFYHHGNLPQTAGSLTQSAGTKVLKTVVNPAELMRVVGETFELAPRLGTFRKAMKQGQSDVSAGWTARNATVDFERRGAAMKAVNMMVPFLNARLQGTLNLKRAVQEAPMATAMRLGVVAGLPAMAVYFNNRLNFPKEFDSIADWEKRGNFVFIYGNGRDKDGNLKDAIKIPKGEVGPIINTVEDTLDYWYGKDQKSFRKKAIEFLNNISPVEFAEDGDLSGRKVLSSTLPPVLKALTETAMGKSLYTGRDIVPQGKVRQPSTASKQYTSETGLPFIKAAQGLSAAGVEVSPMELEHSAGTLFGHLGRRAAQASPTEETWRSYKEGKGPMLGLRLSNVGTGMEKRFLGANAQSQTSRNYQDLRADETAYNDRANELQRSASTILKDFDGKSFDTLQPKMEQAFNALREKMPGEDPAKLAELLVDEVVGDIEAKQKGLEPFERSLLRQPAETRARNIIRQVERMTDAQQKATLLERYFDKKIITKKVAEEMSRLSQ